MRLRNVKNKFDILNDSDIFISDPTKYRGEWNKVFGNNNPIYIEIGSGKCKFLYEFSKKYKDINFIGVEKFASVLALGIKAHDFSNSNIRFINIDAIELDKVFDHEVDRIYLNFSDPWPKSRHEKRRLTSYNYLKSYDNLFKKDCYIEFKTDNEGLFSYSLCSLSQYGYVLEEVCLDLQQSENSDNIKTEYEEKFSSKGFKIFKLKALKKL